MVPKAERERLKLLVKETLTLLCKNGLPYKTHFSLEALVGVTLDKKDVLLVSINEDVVGCNQITPETDVRRRQTAQHASRARSLRQKSRRACRDIKPAPHGTNDTNQATTYGDDNAYTRITMTGQASNMPSSYSVDQTNVDTTQIKMEEEDIKCCDDEEDGSSFNNSDLGSGLDDSSSDSMGSGDEDVESDRIKPDIGSKSFRGDSKDLELRAMETGLLQEYQRAALGQSQSKSQKKSSGSKRKKSDLKLSPMGADESARIWANAKANVRELKETSPKKKCTKKRHSSEDEVQGESLSGDEKHEVLPMCHICGKTMSTEKNLTKHVRRHLGMFSVFCDDCGKGFFDRTDLDAHAAKHVNKKLYQCHVCGRSYSHNRGLLKHIRKDHNGGLLGHVHPVAPAGQAMTTLASNTDLQNLPPPHSTYSAQAPPQQPVQQMMPMTEADSQMSQTSSVIPPQIPSPMPQALPQLSQAQTSHSGVMLPHPPHPAHLRPNLPFPPGLHNMPGESPYYFESSYPSQSVFPGGGSR